MGVVKTFLLPSYGFSFGYKRKGVSIAQPTEAVGILWGTRYELRKATVVQTKILSVTPINPLGVTAPLMNKGSQENGVNAMPCRGYNPSVFSACKTSRKASSPCTGEPRFALNLPCGEPRRLRRRAQICQSAFRRICRFIRAWLCRRRRLRRSFR